MFPCPHPPKDIVFNSVVQFYFPNNSLLTNDILSELITYSQMWASGSCNIRLSQTQTSAHPYSWMTLWLLLLFFFFTSLHPHSLPSFITLYLIGGMIIELLSSVDYLCIWNTHFQTLQASKEMAGRIYSQVWLLFYIFVYISF